MTRLFHEYHKPYLVDESKINRIKNIIEEKFTDLKVKPKYKFDIFTKGHISYVFDNLEDLLSIDNSKKERVRELFITCTEDLVETSKAENKIEVHFHSKENTQICLRIQSENSKWANDTNSLIDEQIERTIQDGLMDKIAHRKWLILGVTVIFLFLLPSIIGFFSSKQNGWIQLDSSDINRIEAVLKDSTFTATEKAAQIFLLNSEKWINQQKVQKRGVFYRTFTNLNSLFIVIPILVVAVSFIYLIFFCYPTSVFLWGDVKEWFKKIVNRRKAVWSLIIFSMLIGILSNLFVLGLSKLLTP